MFSGIVHPLGDSSVEGSLNTTSNDSLFFWILNPSKSKLTTSLTWDSTTITFDSEDITFDQF